jgi:hypothetical protein
MCGVTGYVVSTQWRTVMIALVILGIIGLIELLCGFSALSQSKTVFQEMEGLVGIGFGILTLAVVVGAGAMVRTIRTTRTA